MSCESVSFPKNVVSFENLQSYQIAIASSSDNKYSLFSQLWKHHFTNKIDSEAEQLIVNMSTNGNIVWVYNVANMVLDGSTFHW